MNVRLSAAKVLERVVGSGQSLTTALERELQTLPAATDRAFLQALCYGVCRFYFRLDYVLESLIDKPLKDPQTRLLILLGLYQLAYMRVKTYAAVSETVAAAARKPWSKNLVNALLRRYLRERDELERAADTVSYAYFSHPQWMLDALRQDWPDAAESCLAANNRQAPLTLRVNLGRVTRDDYRCLLETNGMASELGINSVSAVLLADPVSVEALPGFAEGLVSVQDEAAQLAAGLLDAEPGQRVLDLCAAPGGKTAHIMETVAGLKEVIAVDIDPDRMRRVQDNMARLRFDVTTIVGNAANPAQWWDGREFDRILLDAPCSALGVIRRHPDIKLLRRADDITVLAEQQRAILDAAWPMLASGGLLLYATCSTLKAENEQQIGRFLADHSDAAEEPITASWGYSRPLGRQILPGASEMDGFYYARLRKH